MIKQLSLVAVFLLLSGCASRQWQEDADKRFAAYDHAFYVIAAKVIELDKQFKGDVDVDSSKKRTD